MDRKIKGISISILLLGLVSLLNDLSSEMIIPILPMFIKALGGTGIIIGLIGGFRDSISSILQFFGGYWSDRMGKRKVFVVSGYFTSALFKIFLAFSKAWQSVLAFASLERIGKALRSAPRDAIIAAAAPEKRGRGFGIHRAMDTSGAILGSIVVLILFWFWGLSFKTIIFVAGLIALSSLIPLYFVKDRRTPPQKVTVKLGIKSLSKPLIFFIFIAGVFALANFSYMFFILQAQNFFTGKYFIAVPLLLYVLYNIFYAGLAIPFGALSDRIGRRRTIILGYSLFSLTALGFAFAKTFIAFVVLFILYGMVYALVDANQRAYVSDLASEELRATALGTFHTVIGLAALPASLIAGALWQTPVIGAPFIYGCLMSLIAVFLFFSASEYFKKV